MKIYSIPDPFGESAKVSVIQFHSFASMYKKEKSGVKPNTVRWMNDTEANELNESNPEYIEIVELLNPGEHFMRKLTDVTRFNDIIIFSWNPNQVVL